MFDGPETATPDTTTTSTPAVLSAAEVVERVRAYLSTNSIPQAQLAREIDLSASAVSGVLKGSYAGDTDEVARKMLAWLDLRAGRGAGATVLPGRLPWIATPTTRAIRTALQYAHQLGDITVIFGGAGLGKTVTIRDYVANTPAVWVVTADPTTAGVGPLLEELALALGLRDAPLHPARLRREVIRRVDGTGGCLIIDEAQHLTKAALEAVRSIHDATRIGLVLSGNASVYDRLHGGSRPEDFAQIFSRVGRKLKLLAPKDGDVDPLAAFFGFTDAAALAFLREKAKLPGALRQIEKCMRFAAVLASGQQQPAALSHLQLAWRELNAAG
ncbi:AAA family ATPase [Azospirillum sp. RWY-5-1]|uniref:AAA family ATPase n=1 Tax=Azospirillum oleiclasticum TaxID=2735135 RepID=A0ABX2T9R9_9PROT|nr:AAA family ATPase [Azospirillum oleiclasticum]NYZ12856.1 AAA family ATPase [Azospirillum oleiclasticum]NYZ20016.1 AAA family ATPase [Azospirillum oleiclasticum]